MSLWSCDDYTIEKVESLSETFQKVVGSEQYAGWMSDSESGYGVSPAEHGQDPVPNTFDIETTYYVTVQRIPTSTYPNTTDVLVSRHGNFDKFPMGIGNADLLSNLSSFVNTAITSFDAEFDGTAVETPDKTGYTVKLSA